MTKHLTNYLKSASLCLLLILLLVPIQSFAGTSDLTVGSYSIVSKSRVGRTTYEYVLSASVTNNGIADAFNVVGTSTSLAPTMVVTDGVLSFGDVPAGTTAQSADTITVRVDRRFPFDQANLAWSNDASFVSELPIYTPYEKDKVVAEAGGGRYPVNEILVNLHDNYKFEDIQNIANELNGIIASSSGRDNGGKYKLKFSVETIEEIRDIESKLDADPRVSLATLNYVANAYSLNTDLGSLGENLKKAYMSSSIEAAWELIDMSLDATDLTPINIGVSDSPIITSHQEFDNNAVVNGINALPNPTFPPCRIEPEFHGHGTAVAGVIAAKNNNNLGMNGVMTGIDGVLGKLHSIYGDPLEEYNNIKNNADKYDYINMSMGYVSCEMYLPDANDSNDDANKKTCKIDHGYCIDHKSFNKIRKYITGQLNAISAKNPDIMIVAAAGNDNGNVDLVLPAGIDHDNLLTVGSNSYEGNKSVFSNYGTLSDIDISAVGESVYAPDVVLSPSSYFLHNGTSFSAPIVTGVIGLMKSIDPALSPKIIKQIIQETGEDTLTDKFGKSLGDDVKSINAARAVACTLGQKGYVIPFDSDVGDNLKAYIANDSKKEICGGDFIKITHVDCVVEQLEDADFKYVKMTVKGIASTSQIGAFLSAGLGTTYGTGSWVFPRSRDVFDWSEFGRKAEEPTTTTWTAVSPGPIRSDYKARAVLKSSDWKSITRDDKYNLTCPGSYSFN